MFIDSGLKEFSDKKCDLSLEYQTNDDFSKELTQEAIGKLRNSSDSTIKGSEISFSLIDFRAFCTSDKLGIFLTNNRKKFVYVSSEATVS